MRFRILHNGKAIDSADSYSELREKITDDCSIHDTKDGSYSTPEAIFPIIVSKKKAKMQQ